MSTTTITPKSKAKPTEKRAKKRTTSRLLTSPISSGYFLLFALVLLMCGFGLMMVLSSSSVEALRTYGSSWLFFKRQILWLVLGAIAMFVALKIDYRMWRKWAVLLMAASVVGLFLVLIPGIGIEVSGSRRWLGVGSFRMQPSEIAKFAVLIFAADLLSRRADTMNDWRISIRPVLLVFGFFAFLIMLQPDMGTTMVLGAITLTAIFVGGVRPKHLAVIIGGTIAAATVLAIVEPYRRARLLSFQDPCDIGKAAEGGYQVCQSLIGIGSGGIAGVGLGESRAKWGFLPNAHTDFIFSIVGEELGLLGGVAVCLLFVGFAILGIRAASRAPDRFGFILASGITAWVVFQAFLNLGAVIGILPVTGVPLPFISQGGSSLIVLMAATGVLLNIARHGEGDNVGETKKKSHATN